MTYILHLETATKVCSVALSMNGELVAIKEVEEDGYSHGENITLFIQDVLKEKNIGTKDLAAVCVASGPGSYTGLRIGVSTAKGMCYALGIPLIAVDALSSLCELAREKHDAINICAMIDARRMEVFSVIQNTNKDAIKSISADILDENSYKEFEPFVYVGDATEKLADVWTNNEVRIPDGTIKSSARGQIRIAHEAYLNKKFEDVAYFEPFYLKDFVAGKKG